MEAVDSFIFSLIHRALIARAPGRRRPSIDVMPSLLYIYQVYTYLVREWYLVLVFIFWNIPDTRLLAIILVPKLTAFARWCRSSLWCYISSPRIQKLSNQTQPNPTTTGTLSHVFPWKISCYLFYQVCTCKKRVCFLLLLILRASCLSVIHTAAVYLEVTGISVWNM